MANPPEHGSLDPEPSDRKALYSALGWVGVIFIFVVIVLIAWAPGRSEDLSEIHREERFRIKNEVVAEQERLATSYEWVNESEGVVRIPLERAMEITVAEYQASPEDES